MIYKIKFINKQVLILIYYYLVITTVIQMIGVKVLKQVEAQSNKQYIVSVEWHINENNFFPN